MAYTRRQAEWKNYPDTTTPIRAEDLNAIEGGLVDAAGVADTALSTAASASSLATSANNTANTAKSTADIAYSKSQDALNLVGAPAASVMDAYFAGPDARYRYSVGTGGFTGGDVLKLGAYAFNTRTDVGTSLIAGGAPNYENVVGGNLGNVDTGTSNLTGAPTLTGTNGNWNYLLGGYDTVVNGWANSVVGFHSKIDVDANHCTFGGGSRHSAAASTAYGTVGGGTQNQIAGNNPTVAGGNANKATANGSTVAGGQTNEATGNIAAVGGGASNKASGANATVSGGNTNIASGVSSTVAGGQFNVASGVASTASGRECVAYGDQSIATGKGAVAINVGEQVHAGGNRFSYAGDALLKTITLSLGLSTAGPADMQTAGFVPPVIPELTTWMVTADVVARRNDATGEHASWKVTFCVKRDLGNTTALVGTPTVTSTGANAGNTWTLGVNVYSVGNVRLVATGEAGKTTRWVARMNVTQVQATPTAVWAASTAYNTGQRVVQGGGVLEVVNVSGTSGTVQPVTPAIGGTVTDGTVTWLRVS